MQNQKRPKTMQNASKNEQKRSKTMQKISQKMFLFQPHVWTKKRRNKSKKMRKKKAERCRPKCQKKLCITSKNYTKRPKTTQNVQKLCKTSKNYAKRPKNYAKRPKTMQNASKKWAKTSKNYAKNTSKNSPPSKEAEIITSVPSISIFLGGGLGYLVRGLEYLGRGFELGVNEKKSRCWELWLR